MTLKILLIGTPSSGWGAIRSALSRLDADCPCDFTEARFPNEANERMIRSDFDALFLALSPEDANAPREVRQFASFKRPLLIFADHRHEALEKEAAALGADDWLVGEEAGNPAVIGRALRYAMEHWRAERHRRRERKMMQQLQVADGVEILMREAAHSIGNTLTPTQLLAFRGQEMMGEPGKSLFVEIEETIGEASKGLSRMHNLRRGLDGARGIPRLVAIDEALRSSLKPLRRIMPRTMELQVETAAAAGEKVLLDENEFPRIVLNLALNAIHAMRDREDGVLRLNLNPVPGGPESSEAGSSLSGEAGYIELSIADNGTGIDPAYRDRIFTPFFTTKTADGGIGLGLAGCRAFMERHGGTIEVESAPGEGSCFRLRFPRPAEDLAERPRGDYSFGAGNLTLLLIDADERVLTSGSYNLSRIGVSVLLAADGESARQQFAAHRARIDIVQMDPALPDCHGLTLWREFKAREPSLQLIIASAELAELAESGMSGGEPVHTLSKPYTFARQTDLLEHILAEEG